MKSLVVVKSFIFKFITLHTLKYIFRSNRPGRRRAASSRSGRLVAPIMKTPEGTIAPADVEDEDGFMLLP